LGARTIIRKPLVSIAWSSFALTMRVDLSVDLAVTASDEIVDVKASARSKR
jgi:hypothetical protein